MTGRDKQNGNNVRGNLYWNTLLRIPSRIFAFVSSIIVARILMPSDYGIMAIAMMLVGYANLFTNLGFNQAIVQKRIKDKKTLDSIFTVDLGISMFLSFLFFVSAGQIANFFNTPECKKVLQVMSLVFIITSFHALPHGILRRDMRFKVFSIIESFQNLLIASTTLVLAFLGFGYWSLAYGQLIPLAIIAVFLSITAKWLPVIYYKHGLMRDVFHFGLWGFGRGQVEFFSRHLDKFIIGKWIGAGSLGFYDKSMSIAQMPNQSILMNINSVMFSSFSKDKEKKEVLQQQLKKSLALTAIIIYPIYVGLIFVAPYFVHALLGDKWTPMILPFQIILVGFLLKSFVGIIANFNIAVGRYSSHTLRLMVAVVIFFLACVILFRFGLIGVAASFVIFGFSLFILDISLAMSYVKLNYLQVVKVLLSGVLPAIVMVCSLSAIDFYFLDKFNLLNLIFRSFLGAIIYFLLLYFDPVQTSIEVRKSILEDIKKKTFSLILKRNRKDQ